MADYVPEDEGRGDQEDSDGDDREKLLRSTHQKALS